MASGATLRRTFIPDMRIKTIPNGVIALCQDTSDTISSEWFTVDYWRAQQAVVGSSKGRYTTWFVKPNLDQLASPSEDDWVLRHYWRGGLMEKLSKDAYVYTGLHRTRAIGELALLETLYAEGFAVPKPIAAQVLRDSVFYRADIIIERVEGAEDLVARLSSRAMTQMQWHALGQCIARFHQRGVYHADLNAKNILIASKGKDPQLNNPFYLIDFDRGELRAPASQWQQANLDRLLRSFNKEQAKFPMLHFTPSDWQQLTLGYQDLMKHEKSN